jgi:ATP-dependent DNA helicase RecG
MRASNPHSAKRTPPIGMRAPAPLADALAAESNVAGIAGVGPKRAEALASRGIVTLRDLVLHLPSRYQDWRGLTALDRLSPGAIVTVQGELGPVAERPMRAARWRRLASGWLSDDRAARVRLVWFNLPAYMRGRMPAGERVLAHGRVTATAEGALEIVQPELHALSGGEPPPVRPVYALPATVGQRLFASLIGKALDAIGARFAGAIPEELHAGELTVSQALGAIHRPPHDADVAALSCGESRAHQALALDELFTFELAMCLERDRSARRAGAVCAEDGLAGRWLDGLALVPTGAQRRAIAEIGSDLAASTRMNRMLMGDVGSGKTLVAFWAALCTVGSGYQAAIMAPTELLAEQHHASFQRLCGATGVPAALLTGKTTGAARAQVLRGLASGALPIVFGTHAIIQERVAIRRLGLGVVDEQHRFGVFDRARLKALGAEANLLMMTGTPIPRSLAMSLFANLNVSFLDELPPGRVPIATGIFDEERLAEIEEIVRDEVEQGNRAYVVLPRIDADDSEELRSVAAMVKRLGTGALKGCRVGAMHGRMRAADKERVMREFRDGAVQVLVSTTVVEVGIDVPEATVVVVIAAERYGLAQLHQLRGRVGRGRNPSRCCLVASREADETARARLAVMTRCATGAEIAHEDLKLRGPGDILGARQTGALPLRFVHLVRDYHLIERARAMAEEWMKHDPALATAASIPARSAIQRMLSQGFSLGDVG